MKHFGEWVEQYKSEHDWEATFNGGVCYENSPPPSGYLITKVPKYHELPIAMQVGIFIEFLFHLTTKARNFKIEFITGNFEFINSLNDWSMFHIPTFFQFLEEIL